MANSCLLSSQMMSLIFTQTTEYEPGIIYKLLSMCYTDILDQKLIEQLQKFDRAVFENPNTVGACTFISTLNSDNIGMTYYDPRQAPGQGIIGHNCILPEHQRNGYGKQQILEVLKRLISRSIVNAVVSTSEHPFFESARKMYLSCGFTETKRRKKLPHDCHGIIYYELVLEKAYHRKA